MGLLEHRGRRARRAYDFNEDVSRCNPRFRSPKHLGPAPELQPETIELLKDLIGLQILIADR